MSFAGPQIWHFLVEAKRKLTLLYLANDVIQSCKKKGPEFKSEFSKVLPRAFQLVSKEKDDSLSKSVERIVSVWEDRKVFESDTILRLKSLLGMASDVVCIHHPPCNPPLPPPCSLHSRGLPKASQKDKE